MTPFPYTRDTVGPLARSVSDLVLLDQVITGDWSSVDPAAIRTIRLGVVRDPFYGNLEPELAQIMQRTLGHLEAAGVTIIEIQMPGLADVSGKIGVTVGYYEAKRDLAAYLANYQPELTVHAVADQIASPDVKSIFEKRVLGEETPTEAAYREAMEQYRPQAPTDVRRHVCALQDRRYHFSDHADASPTADRFHGGHTQWEEALDPVRSCLQHPSREHCRHRRTESSPGHDGWRFACGR